MSQKSRTYDEKAFQDRLRDKRKWEKFVEDASVPKDEEKEDVLPLFPDFKEYSGSNDLIKKLG